MNFCYSYLLHIFFDCRFAFTGLKILKGLTSPVRKYRCDYCGLFYSTVGNLHIHIKDKHDLDASSEQVCSLCWQTFMNHSSLRSHTWKYHQHASRCSQHQVHLRSWIMKLMCHEPHSPRIIQNTTLHVVCVQHLPVFFVHSVEQKSISVKFSKSRTGSHVTYSCHHNFSRFTFPIFVHSWSFSVFHSLQSITLHIY